MEDIVKRRGVPYYIQPTGEQTVSENLMADCGQDVDLAVALARDIFQRVFHVSPEATFRVRGDGFSPREEWTLPDE